jgi:uncharacterized RDD family membrane protein YckC
MDTAMAKPQTPSSVLQATGKSFGIRAGAYIIDSIVVFIINLAMGLVAGLLIGIIYAVITGRVPVFSEQGNQILNIFISFVLTTIYFTLFEWLYGATPGKLILKMRVIQENGSACGLGSAFTRALLRIIDGLVLGLVAYQSMEAPRYQRVGDKSAKTIVVGAKDPVILEPRPGWGFLAAAVSYLAINGIVTLLRAIPLIR